MTIGDKIKCLRESRKLTQEELGKSTNTTKQTKCKLCIKRHTSIPNHAMKSMFFECLHNNNTNKNK